MNNQQNAEYERWRQLNDKLNDDNQMIIINDNL